MQNFSRAFTALIVPFAASVAMAQHHTHHPSAKPETPSKPPVHVEANASHRSAFADYRRFDATAELRDWREVNRTVHERGGWRAYAKDAAAANAKAGEKRP
ncbi:MAG: hypothetical protein JNJ55_04020 [Betaproteobacteria bacterium]|nr:hypothetical protein [Betaproteobacteria bacterium]